MRRSSASLRGRSCRSSGLQTPPAPGGSGLTEFTLTFDPSPVDWPARRNAPVRRRAPAGSSSTLAEHGLAPRTYLQDVDDRDEGERLELYDALNRARQEMLLVDAWVLPRDHSGPPSYYQRLVTRFVWEPINPSRPSGLARMLVQFSEEHHRTVASSITKLVVWPQ